MIEVYSSDGLTKFDNINIMIWLVFISWAFAGFASQKDKGAIGFLCDSIYLVVPGQFAIYIYA
jgi:hypothetical protein